MASIDGEREVIEDQLREMKRQRSSFAREVGTQKFSENQFNAMTEEISTLETSLREKYGYGVVDNARSRMLPEDYEQRQNETGEEFLNRLLEEDPFAPSPQAIKSDAISSSCPPIQEEDTEEEEEASNDEKNKQI